MERLTFQADGPPLSAYRGAILVTNRTHFWHVLGPGLLFSGAAVGISHLVQATRAGALFGLALVGIIILINAAKYPSFRFGVDYGHAARKSLLAGYRELGLWAPILFCVIIFPMIPIIIAAISATTAGIIAVITGTTLGIPVIASLLLALAAALMIFGGFGWLDRINRVLLAFLIVSTIATTILVLPRVEWGTLADFGWTENSAALLFLVALAGFMPNPMDVSVAQSLWTVESETRMGEREPTTLGEARAAFTTGYVLTAILALCFCIMGAGVMHSNAVTPASDAVGFATQVIGLYRETLGETAAFLASIAALSVMLTTVLAAFDASARVFTSAYSEIADRHEASETRRVFVGLIVFFSVTAMAALFFLLSDFRSFIDFTTSIVFLSAPIVATLNHVVITRCELPDDARPGPVLRYLNILAIGLMLTLAVSYFLL